MSMGVIGYKCGMTRIFTETGESIPVTVIEVIPNRVTQIKTKESDGYTALQMTYGRQDKPQRINKPRTGQFAKAGVEAGRGLQEFRVTEAELQEVKLGDQFTVEMFEADQLVDVCGTSRGKGYAGTVKRHNFSTQDATHGNSLSHRAPGSIGQCQTPGRVRKGKRMAGNMGAVRCTEQSLRVVRVDTENQIILIKGAVPGAPGSRVTITPAVKAKKGAK